jgi:8-oxo-dGTP pyrophosphatase MutT (NUDIX family)
MDAPDGSTALRVDGVDVGWVAEGWLARALEPPTPFERHDGALSLMPALQTFGGRSAALSRWADQARARWTLPDWRDERMVVLDADRPLFGIERALLRPFGLLLRSVLACGFTLTAAGPLLWVARRSLHKPVDPGRLDALVGGGIAGFDAVAATLLRECDEEAAIPPSLARHARPAGALEVRYPTDYDGLAALHRESVTLFDLELPPSFVPLPADGEHEAIVPMTPTEALASIEAGGWTREGAQATMDLILRRGWMPAAGARARPADRAGPAAGQAPPTGGAPRRGRPP